MDHPDQRSDRFLALYYSGESPATKQLRADIARVNNKARLNRNPFERPVLFEGETGSGKEYAARALCAHWVWLGWEQWDQDEVLKNPKKLALLNTAVRDEHFYGVSAADLNSDVGFAELVGRVRGAYTGAIDDQNGILGGAVPKTFHVLIDEIPCALPEFQAHLLRVVAERRRRPVGGDRSKEQPISSRLVFAGNEPLREMVREKRFREDLYHRLSANVIELPPLRKTPDRIVDLASALTLELVEQKTVPAAAKCLLTPEDIEWAKVQPWPGNIRQLRNAIDDWLSTTLLERRVVQLSECVASEGAIGKSSPEGSLEAQVMRLVERLLSERERVDGFGGFIDELRAIAAGALFDAYDRKIISREIYEARFGKKLRSVIDQARKYHNDALAKKRS
jgi:DNA-binding NtrC family response regulator